MFWASYAHMIWALANIQGRPGHKVNYIWIGHMIMLKTLNKI